jgi:hypothetical protein
VAGKGLNTRRPEIDIGVGAGKSAPPPPLVCGRPAAVPHAFDVFFSGHAECVISKRKASADAQCPLAPMLLAPGSSTFVLTSFHAHPGLPGLGHKPLLCSTTAADTYLDRLRPCCSMAESRKCTSI